MSATRWLAADEVAVMLGRDPSAVYRLAYRKQWRKYSWDGRVYYCAADVEAVFTNRFAQEGGGGRS